MWVAARLFLSVLYKTLFKKGHLLLFNKKKLFIFAPQKTKSPLFAHAPLAEIAQLVEHFIRNERVAGSSPAFGSQIEAILLKIKSKQKDTDDGHLASVFFVLPGACSRGAADLLHHAVVIRHDVGPFSRHKHTLVLFPCHVQYLQHTLCRRVKQITVLIFPQYQAHLFFP